MIKTNREELHNLLLKCCDTVYFQPPASVKMQYPCIIYTRKSIPTDKANNQIYIKDRLYQLTIIDKNPDSEIPTAVLSQFGTIGVENEFVTDNLYHTIMNLKYKY